MSAPLYNFTVCQGSDFYMDLLFKDDSGEEIDLDDYTFKGQARKSYDDVLAIEFDFTILDQGTNKGHVTLTINNLKTSSLDITSSTDYLYDIERTTIAGGYIKRVLQGTLTVNPEVTK
jgi:hypothetical protein